MKFERASFLLPSIFLSFAKPQPQHGQFSVQHSNGNVHVEYIIQKFVDFFTCIINKSEECNLCE